MKALSSEWILWLSALMVLIGIILMAAAFYVRARARQVGALVQKLLALVHEHHGDPLKFIPASLPLLRQAGAARVMVELQWFGQSLNFTDEAKQRVDQSRCESHAIEGQEIVLRAVICPRRGLRGEQAELYDILARLWLEVLAAQVNGRLAQIHFSEQQLKRYELFYKHDLKNLAQFMHLLSGQMRRCDTPDCSHALLERLKKVLPDLEERAGRILQHLGKQSADDWSAVEEVSLGHLVKMEARALDLPVEVEGDAEVYVESVTFQHGLRNVMENFKHHPGTRHVRALIETTPQKVILRLTSDALTGRLSEMERARMFEPFWTTSRSGMGLGLYIARQNFHKACRARLDVEQLDDNRWAFVIVCPRLGAPAPAQS
ncbi:ATP-binding protein [Sulfurivirga sp.]|uniref:ATP-binding protein n=1 Tax=Sulfurivirga sp. TaxID=2614236 RepID=UPI0025E6BE3A|nr:ATP-binding protein [Sulfurivirga sp.]